MTQRHASNLRRDALATFLLAALPPPAATARSGSTPATATPVSPSTTSANR